jgi:hypothetical protein
MPEAVVSRITRVDDPALTAFAERVAHSLLAAGHIAAAQLGSSALVELPGGNTLERVWLSYLMKRPQRVQSALGIQSLHLVTTGQVPGFKGIDVRTMFAAIGRAADYERPSSPDSRSGGVSIAAVASVEHTITRPSYARLILEEFTRAADFSCEYTDSLELAGVTVDSAGIAARMTRIGLDFQNSGRLPLMRSVPFACKVAIIDSAAGKLLDRLLDEVCVRVTAGMRAAGERSAELIAAALDHSLEWLFGALATWWDLGVVALATHLFDASSGQSASTHVFDANSHDGRFTLKFAARSVG